MDNANFAAKLLVVLCLLLVLPAVIAQDAIFGVEITSPVEVTELFGDVVIEGAAAVPGMAYYYLEIHPLTENLDLNESTSWIPLTGALEEPIIDGEFATVDTNRIDDGLYALRLTVNTADNQSFHTDISPVHVSNERFTELLGESDEGRAVQLPLLPEDSTPVPGVLLPAWRG